MTHTTGYGEQAGSESVPFGADHPEPGHRRSLMDDSGVPRIGQWTRVDRLRGDCARCGVVWDVVWDDQDGAT